MWEWTLPSENKPMKCSVEFFSMTLPAISFQAGEAVGLQFRVRAVFEHPVQIGLVGGGYGVAVRVFAETDAVHDDEHDGALAAFEPSGFFQFVNHFERYSF